MKQEKNEISVNLKKIRDSRNFSLDKLADITGVSKSMLRQIEMGKSSPTIATIWKIANGLKISFTSLIKSEEIEVEVADFKTESPLTAKAEHYRLFPLISFDPKRSFEIYYIEIDPKTTFEGEPHAGDVIESLFVTSGEIQVQLDDKKHMVKKNQFINFPANRPHFYTCTSKRTATAIMHISYA